MLIKDPSETQDVSEGDFHSDTFNPRSRWQVLVLSKNNGETVVKAERRYSNLKEQRELLIFSLYLYVSSSLVEKVENEIREAINRLVEQFPDLPRVPRVRRTRQPLSQVEKTGRDSKS